MEVVFRVFAFVLAAVAINVLSDIKEFLGVIAYNISKKGDMND